MTEGLTRRPDEYVVDLSSVSLGHGGQDALTATVKDIQRYSTGPDDVTMALTEAARSPESAAKLVRDLEGRRDLSPFEHAISSQALSLCMAGYWQYNIRPLDNAGTLFDEDGLPASLQYSTHVALPATSLDAIVLSGIAGLAVLDAADDEKIERRLNRIFNPSKISQLQRLRILGALAFPNKPIDETFARVWGDGLEDGRSGYYMVGNDMNGDFAIQQALFAGRPGEEIRDPMGEKTRFIKPAVSDEFITATYHDFVPIIRGMLDHLRFELPADEIGWLRYNLLGAVPGSDGKSRGNFGNFGDVSALQIGETTAMRDIRREYKDGDVVESGLSNTNGFNDHHYILVHRQGGLELQQASTVRNRDKRAITVEKSITISNSDIRYLVGAMVRQQSSRASDEYIAWTIATILSNQEQ